MKKSVRVHHSLLLQGSVTNRSPIYRSGSAFSYQPSISDSITSTGPVGTQRISEAARLGETRESLFPFFPFLYQSRGKFDGACGSGLRKSTRRGKTDQTGGCTYYSAPSVETEKSKLGLDSEMYSILPALSLILARKSIFVTADWARLDSRG